MKAVATVLLLGAACNPSMGWASDPGQPLDCSDWVFLQSGFHCEPWIPYRCSDEQAALCLGSGKARAFDSEGWHYRLEEDIGHHTNPCGAGGRLYIYRYNGETEEVFAYIDERCNGVQAEQVSHRSFNIDFDPVGGRLLLYLTSECFPSCSYPDGDWVASIEGFTTTFEIMQTYQPTLGPLGFRVPLMPEGLPAADSFNTYWGNLTTVGDWSQVQGLQCDYPPEIPSTGDYLTVADTLPTPAPGEGYYYVTAVTHQGATRYGRKRIGGVTGGRDPVVLPGCE